MKQLLNHLTLASFFSLSAHCTGEKPAKECWELSCRHLNVVQSVKYVVDSYEQHIHVGVTFIICYIILKQYIYIVVTIIICYTICKQHVYAIYSPYMCS